MGARVAHPVAVVAAGVDVPLARFSVSGFDCVVVSNEAQPESAGDEVGALVIDGRRYLIRAERPLAVTPDLLDVLTSRELEIALLVASGERAKAIARRLRISFHTVRVHVGRIYAKLGLRKQTELAARIGERLGTLGRRR